MDTNQSGRLEEEVSELRSRVVRMEETLESHGVLLQRMASQLFKEQRIAEPPVRPTAPAYRAGCG